MKHIAYFGGEAILLLFFFFWSDSTAGTPRGNICYVIQQGYKAADPVTLPILAILDGLCKQGAVYSSGLA